MGITIMGADLANSVKDAGYRSHDHSNLFIGGPSVPASDGAVKRGMAIAAAEPRLSKRMIAKI